MAPHHREIHRRVAGFARASCRHGRAVVVKARRRTAMGSTVIIDFSTASDTAPGTSLGGGAAEAVPFRLNP